MVNSVITIGKILLITFIATILLQSCGSLADNPYYQEGYRQGWNMTAPSEYRY